MSIASDSSDKDSESESENNQYNQESFKEDLRNWTVTHQVPNSTISDLLSILRKQHAYLPRDRRTLLKPKVNYAVSFKQVWWTILSFWNVFSFDSAARSSFIE